MRRPKQSFGNDAYNLKRWISAIQGRKPALRWVITTLIGALTISLLGTPKIDNSRIIFLRLSIPVLIILIYAWLGYKDVKRVKDFPTLRNARIGQLADSVYFLGFLWTLWALIDSFVIHQLSIAEAVFRAFGYALVTTASGMFLRLALLQFSYSAGDQQDLSNQNIEEEMANFSAQIGKTVSGLKDFQGKLNNSANAIEKAAYNINTKTKELEDAINLNKKSVNNIVDKVVNQFTEGVNERFDKLNNSVEKGINSINKKTVTITEKITENENKIIERLVNTTNSVEKSTASFSDSLIEQMNKIVSNLAVVSKQINNIRIPSNTVEESLRQQTDSINNSLMNSAKTLQNAIENLTNSVNNASTIINYKRPWWDKIKFW